MKNIPVTKTNDFKTPIEILKSARVSKGFSIRELAHKAGCSHVHLLKIERGEKQPSPKLLDQLQRELGLGQFLIAYSTKSSGGLSRLSGIDTIEDEIIHLPIGTGTVVALIIDALQKGGYKPTLWKTEAKDLHTTTALTIEVDLGSAGRITMPVQHNI